MPLLSTLLDGFSREYVRTFCSLKFVRGLLIVAMLVLSLSERFAHTPLWAQEPATAGDPGQTVPPLPPRFVFRLEPLKPIELTASVSGIVDRVFITRGQSVTQNDPVVEVNADRLKLILPAVEKRFELFFEAYREAMNQEDLEQQELALARKEAAAVEYDLLKLDIAQHTITTPISGVVDQLLVQPGDYARRGALLAEIRETSELQVRLPLSKRDLRLGDSLAVFILGTTSPNSSSAQNRTVQDKPQSNAGFLINGTVTAIESLQPDWQPLLVIDPELSTTTVTISNAQGLLTSGQVVLLPQPGFAIVPTNVINTSAPDQPTVETRRNNQVVSIPILPLSSVQPGFQFVAGNFLPDDQAIVPGPATAVPQFEEIVVFSTDTSYLTAEKITELNLLSPEMLGSIAASPAVPVSNPNEPAQPQVPQLQLPVPAELVGLLEPSQLPLCDLDLETLFEQLELAPDDRFAFEQLQKEFQAKVDEQGLRIESLQDLKDIEGVAEYEKFLQAIQSLNQQFAQDLLRELDEEQAEALNSSLVDLLGVPASTNMGLLDDLQIDQAAMASLQSELHAQQFDILKKLLASETTLDAARQTLNSLLDNRDQQAQAVAPPQAQEILQSSLQKRQQNLQQLTGKTDSSTSPSDEVPSEKTTSTKRSTPFTPPPLQTETDYVLISMIAAIVLIVVGALGHFAGLFKLLMGLFTARPSQKKGTRASKKLKHVHRLEVGPDKAFTTIKDALLETINHPFLDDGKTPWQQYRITISPGVYQENIYLDSSYPAGIYLAAELPGQVTIIGDGSKPVFDINGVSDMTLDGLIIDGEAAPTVVQLRDLTTTARITQTIITGFKQFGLRISSHETEGRFELKLDETLFLSAILETTGMFLDYGNFEHSSLIMHQCRFHGPMKVGVQFRGTLHETIISETLFAFVGQALSLAGTAPPFQSMVLTNNTFYQCQSPLYFRRADMLLPGSREVLLFNNLFAESELADVQISTSVDAETQESLFEFLHAHSAGNLTDRGQANDFAQGYLTLNDKAGKLVDQFKFKSIDIEEPEFLMPTPDAQQRQAWSRNSRSRKLTQPYVGALGPRSVVKSFVEEQV